MFLQEHGGLPPYSSITKNYFSNIFKIMIHVELEYIVYSIGIIIITYIVYHMAFERLIVKFFQNNVKPFF